MWWRHLKFASVRFGFCVSNPSDSDADLPDDHSLFCWIAIYRCLYMLNTKSDDISRSYLAFNIIQTHTRLMAIFPGLPGWDSTRKVKPIWILLKQETVSGSGISWAICKSAPRSRQITTPARHHSVFYRTDALPAAQPTASKHWRDRILHRHQEIAVQCAFVYFCTANDRQWSMTNESTVSLNPT